MARGRKRIEINRAEFQAVLAGLETTPFANRTLLWEAVEATNWAKAQTPRPLTAQVAMMKAKEFNLEIKTPLGRRGREKGCGPVPGSGRKKKSLPEEAGKKVGRFMTKKEREKYAKTIEKFQNGSLKAAIKLKCLECCCWQPGEVAHCQSDDCPLWHSRPYKRTSVVKELL